MYFRTKGENVYLFEVPGVERIWIIMEFYFLRMGGRAGTHVD